MSVMTVDKAEEIVLHDARKAALPKGDNDAHSRWWKRAHDLEAKHGVSMFSDLVQLSKGYLTGHASRDPEVADLKKDLALNASMLAKQCDLAREAEGELEKLKSYTKEKFSCPCGETTYLLEQNPNHFVGCISHNPTKVEKLKASIIGLNQEIDTLRAERDVAREAEIENEDDWKAGREASRRLAEAAERVVKHIRIVCPEDKPLMSTTVRLVRMMEEPLKFYATPGHSPEGKTL